MRRALAAAFAAWSLWWSMVAALVVGMSLVLPFAWMRRGVRERYTLRGAQVWARIVIHGVLLARVRVRGSLDVNRGALLVSNHRSWLDPLLLIAFGRSNGLSKKLVWYIPAVGLFGWLTGAVYFDRKSKTQRALARADVMHLIRSGNRVQLFPEGTRSRDGVPREKVYLTLVRDCWEEQIPVVPCAVAHTERSLPVGAFAAHPGQEVALSFGETLEPCDYPDADAYAAEVWNRVKRLLGEMG